VTPSALLSSEEECMAAKRTGMHRLQELVRLYRMGTGCRERARLLAMGRNTEKTYREAIAKAGLLEGEVQALPELEQLRAAVLRHAPPKPPPQQTSSVESWRPRIDEPGACTWSVASAATPSSWHSAARREDFAPHVWAEGWRTRQCTWSRASCLACPSVTGSVLYRGAFAHCSATTGSSAPRW
jgi:hypothetical protein